MNDIARLMNPPRRWSQNRSDISQEDPPAPELNRDNARKLLRAIRLNGGGMVRLRGQGEAGDQWAASDGDCPRRPALIVASTDEIRAIESAGLFCITKAHEIRDRAGLSYSLPYAGRLTGEGLKRGE